MQGYIFWPFWKFFVQSKKTGKNLKDLKKGREKGRKQEKKKGVIKHKNIFMKLKYRKKSTNTGKTFRGGEGRIFLAGQNIYPWSNVCLFSWFRLFSSFYVFSFHCFSLFKFFQKFLILVLYSTFFFKLTELNSIHIFKISHFPPYYHIWI